MLLDTDGDGNILTTNSTRGRISDIQVIIFGEAGQVFLQRRAGMR